MPRSRPARRLDAAGYPARTGFVANCTMLTLAGLEIRSYSEMRETGTRLSLRIPL
jgi:hypothetical protein